MIIRSNLDFIHKLVYANNDSKLITKKFAELICRTFNYLIKPYSLKVSDEYNNLMMTHEGMLNIYWLVYLIIQSGIEGDVVEIGCYDGMTSILISNVIRIHNSNKKLYLYDSFEGLQDFSEYDQNLFLTLGDCKTNIVQLINNYKKFKVTLPRIIVGNIHDTLPKKLPDKISLVHLDLDLYSPTLFSLKTIIPRLSKGAIVILDDYDNPAVPGVKHAVEKFFNKKYIRVTKLYAGEYPILPGRRPTLKHKQILNKYQAFFMWIN